MNNEINIESLKQGNRFKVVPALGLRLTKIALMSRKCAMVLFVLNIIVFLLTKKKTTKSILLAIFSTIVFGVSNNMMNRLCDFSKEFTPNLSKEYDIRVILEILFFIVQIFIFIKLITINSKNNNKKKEENLKCQE